MRSAQKRRWLHRVVIATTMALVLSACGNGEEQSAGDDTAAEEPATDDGDEADGDAADSSEESAEDDEFADARDFYDGEQFTFVVSYGEGGGYDTIARALAPYLEEELGADVLIDNRPGAGGLVAANSLFTGDDSGLEAGFFSGQGMAGAVVGGAEGATFEMGDFSFIARAAEDPRVFTVGASSGHETIDDVLADDEFLYGSSGPGGSDHIDANVLCTALELNCEIITGFSGSAETELAATSGQTEGASGTYGSRSGAIEAGDHIPVLAISADPIEDIPDVPTILEMELTGDAGDLAQAHLDFQRMGRMILAPPGIAEDRLAFMRQAFRNAIENPDFVAEMEKIDQPITYLSGEDLATVAEEVLNAPEVYVSLMEEAYGG